MLYRCSSSLKVCCLQMVKNLAKIDESFDIHAVSELGKLGTLLARKAKAEYSQCKW